MKLKNSFTNSKNQTYNIRNINYEKLGDICGDLGVFVNETDYNDEKIGTMDKTNYGIYLYKSNYDSKKALRIYKDFADYRYLGYRDEKMISKLQARQKNVKLTEFPTGVVTIENKIIGQEVPYYEKYDTLHSTFKRKKYKKNPTHYYIQILNIIRELYQSGIAYSDIHARNLLFNKIDETIKLIDFDCSWVKFDDDCIYIYRLMVQHLKEMILKLNELSNIEFLPNFNKTQTLNEIEESILENHQRLL